MIDSVRSRLTLWYALVLGGVLAVFSVGVYGLLFRVLHERVDDNLRAVVEVAATSLRHDTEEGQDAEDAARSTVAELSSRQERLAIYDGQGVLLARSPAREPLDPRLPAAERVPSAEPEIYSVPEEDNDDDWHRVAAQRVSIPPRGTPYLVVASQSLDDVQDELESLREVLFTAVPVAILAAGIPGWLLARKSLAPVVVMAERARRMGAETLGGALPVANPRDELGRLAAAFNELLARLHAAFMQQRQFMADASHELRTPLSAVRAAADVTLQRPQREETEYREALGLVGDHARRLTRIVEDMFTLARADAGHQPLRRSRFYLDGLLADVGRAARLVAAPHGVTVEVTAPAESPVEGDEDLLRRLVLNLVDNAVKHSPAGGVVRVDLTRLADTYRMTVSDQGPGIPAEAQARVFERFYRVDEARSRAAAGEQGAGAGLGLAIARWVAEAHAGTLELVRSEPGGGTVFAATLPAGPGR
jgi:two-component system OmpR family sensor kinase